MKSLSALVFLSLLAASNAFVASPSGRAGLLPLIAVESLLAEKISNDEVDFDAPTRRAAAVGNIVRTPSIGLGSFQVSLPRFLSQAFGRSKSSQQEEIFLEDEECYLGKDGSLDHCADYDPPHNMLP